MFIVGKNYRDAQGGKLECTFVRDGIAYLQASYGPAYRYTLEGVSLDLSEAWNIVGTAR